MSDNLLTTYFGWIRLTVAIFIMLPAAILIGTLAWAKTFGFVWIAFLMLFVLALIPWIWRLLGPPMRIWEKSADRQSTLLADAIDALDLRVVSVCLILATALSLILELSFIRWLAALYEIFAFYKNFMLLACFAGLGVGYATFSRRLCFAQMLPVLGVGLVAIELLRYAMPAAAQFSLRFLPVVENLAMGLGVSSAAIHFVAIYVFLTGMFVFTATVFLPVGQLCGRLMSRLPNLKAYAFNLIGSLIGVVAMILFGQLWTPPIVWFGVAICLAVYLLMFSQDALKPGVLPSLICLIALGTAGQFGVECIYSPYQLLEVSKSVSKTGTSWLELRAAGHYYQRILDLSVRAQADPDLKKVASYYEMPYRIKPNHQDVAVVGAGTGNDVAAALRSGAEHVDAVEIDPAIQRLGRDFHPEAPYKSDKVTTIVDDARQFLRKTNKQYDLVVFGLLDSHTATSQASQLRTDSYIYTVDALKDVRKRLKDDGVVSLAFSSLGPDLDKKLKLMMRAAFDKEPVALRSPYDGNIMLLESKSGVLEVPPAITESGYFTVDNANEQSVGDIDVSTDDWPFFYMPHKLFPLSYLPMLALIVAIAAAMMVSFKLPLTQFNSDGIGFFLLGSGFMLVETKSITEIALYFGNTWLVTGIVIAAILLMAFLSNLIVDRFKPENPVPALLCLLAALGFGIYVHRGGVLSASSNEALLATAVTTLPIAFSGIVFSILLRRTPSVGAAMSMNLVGALVGGAMEYLALWLGYEALYMVAAGIYLLAMINFLPIMRRKSA